MAARARLKFSSLNYKNIFVKIFTRFDRCCPWTDDFMYINVKGKAQGCCNLWSLQLGDLVKGSVEEVWKGKQFLHFFNHQKLYCRDCDSLKFRQV